MTTPQTDLMALGKRLAHYARERRKMLSLDHEHIHALHSPPDPRHAELLLSDIEAAILALAGAETPQGMDDGSVRVRVDPMFAEHMRAPEGLVGPFSAIRLVEPADGEPRLELTTASTPTPDTVEWWREIAQGLGVEIHKLKLLAAAPPPAVAPAPVVEDGAALALIRRFVSWRDDGLSRAELEPIVADMRAALSPRETAPGGGR